MGLLATLLPIFFFYVVYRFAIALFPIIGKRKKKMWETPSEKDNKWLYIGEKGGVFGLHEATAEEMLKKAARGELKDSTLIRPEFDIHLHSYGAWKKVCIGMNPFLIDCESYDQMKKLNEPSDDEPLRFSNSHMLIPPQLVTPRKPTRMHFNRFPRKPFLSESETVVTQTVPISLNSTGDSAFNSSVEDTTTIHFPIKRTVSCLTSNFLASLEDTSFRRKNKHFTKTVLKLKKQGNINGAFKISNNLSRTGSIVLSPAEASRILSEYLGFEVQVV